MKVSAIGLLTNVRDILPKRCTEENQVNMHKFMLDEMIKHIKMVRDGTLDLNGFAYFYCITPQQKAPTND